MGKNKYQDAVQSGIKILNNYFPDTFLWEWIIDRSKLNMADNQNCILGQLFGFYRRGVEILHPLKTTNREYLWEKWTIKNGFLIDFKESELLTQEWKRQLHL